METTTTLYIVYSLLTLMVLVGIWMMSRVELAKRGNSLSAIAMLLAVCVSLWLAGTSSLLGILCSICVGTALGLRFAYRVQMIQMPQMVALLNGLGGAASALVGGLFLLTQDGTQTQYLSFNMGSALLAIVIGLITLVGSLVAAGKLHRLLAQKPVVYPGHQILSALSIGLCVGVVFVGYSGGANEGIGLSMTCLAVLSPIAFGWLFAIRVGGADMPITISLLNSLSGLAGAIAGLATGDIFLVAVGGIVGASGLLLTQIMCRAMNRSLTAILFAKDNSHKTKQAEAPKAEAITKPEPSQAVAPQDDLGVTLHAARNVIIVPGYGMALSQAQSDVYTLAEKLKAQGARVRYAIHPVAGRMPGHMNVLLSEAGVDYEEQVAMDDINDDFKASDLVVVIGANDVLNPAARHAEGTPIYGMPVLSVDEARQIVICNFDLNPGYAGVPNPLYTRAEGVHLLLGDAKESVRSLINKLSELETPAATTTQAPQEKPSPKAPLHAARNVIIVPGYGMALSQAQSDVYALAEKLKAQGARVRYAIHPVAGRMPGHMNVLLSEAGVDYEEQVAMDDINDDFKASDLVVVIGANDVLNPAARHAEGTPIYGMPVLSVDEAKEIVICNFDLSPGYAGVPNPLYTRAEGVHLLLGDAKESVRELIRLLEEPLNEASPAPASPAEAPAGGTTDTLASLLPTAREVIIVPGYGMALSQAQHEVRSLAQKFIAQGARVRYAIHPVAGRMPGHMNVLLCEADVAYEDLYEMEGINGDFKTADLVVVIGANDVLNPAARDAEGTPIYGMPVLNVDEARQIVICNFDLSPGYAGVPNPLYTRAEGVHLLLGDAKESVRSLIALLG